MSDVSDSGGSYIGQYDWDEYPLTTAIVEAVSNVTGRQSNQLGPLYDVVDPDALKLLLSGFSPTPRDLELTFTFEGCRVTVHADGTLMVTRG